MVNNNSNTAKVVIYTTQRCPHCKRAKEWLREQKVLFLEFDVGKAGKMQKHFFSMGGRSVPMIVIGDRQLPGFAPKQLRQVLEQAGILI
ncbi:NrdH-redoxin [bacterium endosymbiont of Escarpia laminata]|nr:MAG: NrdH-redoxin [bacterium endosymbiont of Escarpia laminata]RLJ20255.1 MAG: NrdH-redoxin [bacterium endosymbiont of Escarpia laminata]